MAKDEIRFSVEYGRRNLGIISVPDFARMAERLGYDGITVASFNPLIVLAQAAAVTEHVILSTSILVLPFFNPVVLAHQTASLDYHSGGRLVLGVGVGGERPQEFQNFGVPWQERGVRANETIEILQGLWSQPSFSYKGQIFRLDDASLEQWPIQKPHPPIWVGGRIGGRTLTPEGKTTFKSKVAAMRRAALYGDGWVPYLTDPEEYRWSVERVKMLAKEYGRENHPMTFAHNMYWSVGDEYEEALEAAAAGNSFGGHRKEFSAKYDIVGTPKDCIKRAQEYVDAGVRHFMVKPLAPSEKTVEEVERVATEIIPYFK